ncbi:MAG: carbohydrate ABC transporter permease [Rhodothermales bacterium]
MKSRVRNDLVIVSFVLPAFTVYTLFVTYPFLRSFVMSLKEWSGFSLEGVFVGLENYQALLSDRVVGIALRNNVYILFWCTLITFALSLFFAVVISRRGYRAAPVFKTVFFIPHVMSMAIVAIIWTFIYNPSFGVVNRALAAIGLESLQRIWLGDRDVIMGALTVPLVWFNLGFYMVIFISAIAEIDSQLFDAAEIDGASELQKFLYVIVPSIWNFVRIALVFFVITAFNYSFELVYVITQGGPNRASELLTTYLYEQAFERSRFGYAAAVGIVVFLIVFVLIALLLRGTRRKGDEL